MTLKEEFEEKFCYEMMNFDHTNRHHYLAPYIIEKPQLIIDWIEQKIKEAEQKQREISADIFKQYSALTDCTQGKGFAYQDDFNIYCKILEGVKK